MSDRDPTHLHPHVQTILSSHCLQAASHGLLATVIETYRNEADQLANWKKGRNSDGIIIDSSAVVTNARPGQSYHGVVYPTGIPCSLAYHLAISLPGGDILGFGKHPMDQASEMLYTGLGILGEHLGMTWGGRWQHLRDWTHFEFRIPGKTLDDITMMMKTMGDIDSLFLPRL